MKAGFATRFLAVVVAIVVAAGSGMICSRLTTGGRVLRVTIPPSTETNQNLTVKAALSKMIDVCSRLEDLATNKSSPLGASLADIVQLTQKAREQSEDMWSKLEREIVEDYFSIRDMIYRVNRAWTNPALFKPEWFEDPSQATVYARYANRSGILRSQVLGGQVDIRLCENRSVACVTYVLEQSTAGGTVVYNTTDVMVRKDGLWKFRSLGVATEAQLEVSGGR